MAETLISFFVDSLEGKMGSGLILFFVSLMPILEVRGGLIAASAPFLNVPLNIAIPICMVGNILPIPFILLAIKRIFTLLKKTRRLSKIVVKLENKAISKSDKIAKYEFWGLVFFVGVPLPGTGAWTGALIAALLNIQTKKAFIAILLGVVIATTIMSTVYIFLGHI